jgi:Leucine-rich repeat (LRR) protein
MFWLSFVYPRSHSGWIGPIGEFRATVFIQKPAYRYSILSFPDLHSIWTKRVAFLMPVHTSRIGWLVFCMNWLSFVYPGPIPAELDQLANLQVLSLENNKLTGNHPLLPLACIQYVGKGLLSSCPFIPVGLGDLVFVLIDWVLYTPGPIPAELGQLANLQQLDLSSNQLTGNHHFFPLTCIQYERKGLLSLCLIAPVRWRDLVFVCFDWVLYALGPIPAELGRLVNLQNLNLSWNKLTGIPSLSPWRAFNMKEEACYPYARSYQSDRVTWFLYVLTEFCIPQVPFRLNWANWRI